MNSEKYLPIGTVVMLKNGKKRVMVTGFAARSKETDDKLFDYMGCLYPEGVISSDKNLLFNHEQIDQIHHLGLVDDEWKTVEAKIKEIVAQVESMPPEETTEVVEEEQPQEVAVEPAPVAVQQTPIVEEKSVDDMFKINTDLFN